MFFGDGLPLLREDLGVFLGDWVAVIFGDGVLFCEVDGDPLGECFGVEIGVSKKKPPLLTLGWSSTSLSKDFAGAKMGVVSPLLGTCARAGLCSRLLVSSGVGVSVLEVSMDSSVGV